LKDSAKGKSIVYFEFYECKNYKEIITVGTAGIIKRGGLFSLYSKNSFLYLCPIESTY
jgi:hypothetical protein